MSFVVERVPPPGAPYMGAQRYQAEYFLPAGQSWRIAGFVAAGKIDYLADFDTRQICQVVSP